MKYRYTVLSVDGESPEGTNDDVLARKIADESDDDWVIDNETGTIMGPSGDPDNLMGEVDAAEWFGDSGDTDGDTND